MGLTAYNEIIMVSRADDQEAILTLLQNMYATDRKAEFNFMNVYKELPVTSSGAIVEFKENTVEFAMNATQFAAITLSNEVLIQSNTMSTNIIGKAFEFDVRRHQITLGDFSYAEIHADKRVSVRVQLKMPINLQMVVDGNQLNGVIRDISLHGVRVTTFSGDILEKASSIELRIKLLHSGSGQLVETLIPSRLVRMEKSGVQSHCAMVFNHTALSEQVLSTFIYQRQLEIIKELRDKI